VKHIFSSSAPIQIVDVGASAIEDKPVYDSLVDDGLARVTGFEPAPEEFERLKDLASESRRYLPYALGDGTEQTLHVCQAPGMTSLFEPDMDHLSHFHGFEDWAKVVDRLPIQTYGLDDLAEIESIDFLKIDTQGAEHQIIDNGREKISEAVALHIELSFKPLYYGERPFGEVDILLGDLGFVLHTITEAKQRAFRPMIFNNSIYEGRHHIQQVDAVYIKDFQTFSTLPPE